MNGRQKKIFGFFFATVCTVGVTWAQKLGKKIYNTPLWQITGNGLEKPSYLFGSLHTLSADWLTQYPAVSKKLEAAGTYIGERKLFEFLQKGQLAPNNDTPLIKAMTPGQYQFIDSFLKVNYEGASLQDGDAVNFTIVDLLGIVGDYMAQKNGPKGQRQPNLDASLQRKAVDLGKEIIGLETEEALNAMYINGRPLSGIVDKLITVLKYADTGILKDQYTAITGAYLALAIDYNFAKESGNPTAIDQRNLLWLPKIVAAIRQKPCFIHVGLGHLEYKQGLILLLRQKGFKLKPVPIR
jgi:uncharacterized protein